MKWNTEGRSSGSATTMLSHPSDPFCAGEQEWLTPGGEGSPRSRPQGCFPSVAVAGWGAGVAELSS